MHAAREVKTTPFRMTRTTRALLAGWMMAHTEPEAFLDTLPKLGLMVSHCNKPVGVVFLRHVEGLTGMIDGFLCDPDVPHRVRTVCLDQLIVDVIKLAAHNDMRGIFGLTVNKRVIERARRLGFEILAHKAVSMRLSPWDGVQ